MLGTDLSWLAWHCSDNHHATQRSSSTKILLWSLNRNCRWSPNWSIHVRGLSMWSPLSRFLWRNTSPFIGGWTCHCSRWSLSSPRHFLYPLMTLNVQFVDEPFYLHVNYPWRSGLLASTFTLPERSGDVSKKNIYTTQSKLATTWSNPGCCERYWKQTCTTDSGKAIYSILQWSVRVSWREGTSTVVVKKEAEMCASPHYTIRHVCWTYRKSETEKLL